MADIIFYRNWDNSDTTTYTENLMPMMRYPQITDVGGNDWTKSGAVFDNWNTSRDGTGIAYYAGDIIYAAITCYAIWQASAPSKNVVISLGTSEIASMNAAGTKTLATENTFVPADITVEYSPSTLLQNKTVSPTTSSQSITADSGYDGLETVTVNAISPIKSSATYMPSTVNQYISAGQWIGGAQTIFGDANLTAENIKKDVSIFGVTGTYEGSGGGGGGPLHVYTVAGWVNGQVSGVVPRVSFSGPSIVDGATITFYTYGDYILDSITGEDSGTTYPFTTVQRGTYTFTMPNESVYCDLYYDD